MTAPAALPLPHTLARLRGGLIVSCQAPPGDPLSGPEMMSRLARSVVAGGAVGVRAEGLDDLAAIRRHVDVPVIGLVKDGREGVYITPTVAHAEAVAALGVELVAVDATDRPRPDGRALDDTIAAVHRRGAGLLADVADLEQGRAAAAAGADVVATTLSGYLGDQVPSEPDLGLLAALSAELTVPVIAEGRYRTADDVRAALEAGAWAVVVGTAITRPQIITRTLIDAVRATPTPPEQEPQ
ncbi:MAG: N-acetylmannosamine-6-phosphate 2-epimerase [Nitriliruptoraceae bacterium]